MYKVSPTGDLIFLRLLLLQAKGAKSWEDLRTVNGIVLETFREACVFNGLLQDDTEWQNTLSEAVLTRMPKQIRQLFSIILTFCEPDDPLHLWNSYKAFMMEDFNHRQVPFILAEQATLLQIEKIINQSGKMLPDYNLPVVDEIIDFIQENLNNNVQQSIDEANRMRPLLNVNQFNVSNAVFAALNEQPCVENQNSRLFFMDGPAGSGKTFTYNYLIAEMNSRGVKSATAAWTGIAATLLTNGSTLHGLFKLPVPILDNSTCNVTPNSIQGQILWQVSLFMLDETSMIPKHALNAMDRLLKDVCNNNFPFGGKVILFGGDFRQILPVVKRGRPTEVVESCIKCSLQWQWVQKFTLTQNMRVRDGEGDFSEWLLKLGSGTIPGKEEDPFKGCIEIPQQCIIRENESIVEKIFRDAQQDDYAKRVILTPTNVDSLSINEEVLERLHGEVKTYLSADQIDTDDLNEINNFPVEFLNSLTTSGMPTHCLKLKIGCVIMLLKNLDLKAGLCNGTRMKVCALQNNYIDAEVLTGVSEDLKAGLCNGTRIKVYALQNNYIDAEVLTGVSEGKRVFVPRIQFAPSDSNLPFVLKRCQSPVRLAYSMTINKSQGQTFDRV
nr:ATP-dependent DNA helicase pif1-like [Hydra vulgaris]